jgi:hypothetical protein
MIDLGVTGCDQHWECIYLIREKLDVISIGSDYD